MSEAVSPQSPRPSEREINELVRERACPHCDLHIGEDRCGRGDGQCWVVELADVCVAAAHGGNS